MNNEEAKEALLDRELIRKTASDWGVADIPKGSNDLQTLLDELARWYLLTHPDFVTTAQKNDPAIKEKSLDEAKEELQSYPFVAAIAAHEIAHHLYNDTECGYSGKIVARRLAEAAHSRSGIDIHPGTTIGENCFIDHGTGVIIGETAKIGKNTMIYHDATLGNYAARGVDPAHRHPEIGEECFISTGVKILGHVIIGNKVTICPDARLVGNNITIGDNVTIGIGTRIMNGNHIASQDISGEKIRIGAGVIIEENVGDINVSVPNDCMVSRDADGKLNFISAKENDGILHKFVKMVMELMPNNLSPSPAI